MTGLDPISPLDAVEMFMDAMRDEHAESTRKAERHRLDSFVQFYNEHDPERGFAGEQYQLPVPPLQPDGDYDPDEQAVFSISE